VNAGIIYYNINSKENKRHKKYYNLDNKTVICLEPNYKLKITVQIRGFTFVFNITSETSSGHGENWVRIGL